MPRHPFDPNIIKIIRYQDFGSTKCGEIRRYNHREEVKKMAGGMWNPKNRKIITIVALVLIIAMIVPSVLSLILGWF